MFFKTKKEPVPLAPEKPATSIAAPAGSRVTAASAIIARPDPLSVGELRRIVDPATLGFKTTDELEPISGLIGQDRALKAIQFGANMKSHDFNMFVLGPPASGKSTAVKAYLERKAREAPPTPDLVYVDNFEAPNKPKALTLPHGRARAFAKGMVAAIDELRNTLPAIFESDDYQVRRRAIDEEFRSGQEEAFEALSKRAQAQNIAVLRTPTGFAMAPVHEGKVVKPEVFNSLPETMRKDVEAKIEVLQKELELILERVPKSDKQRRQRLAALNDEVAKIVVREALDDVAAAFADVPGVTDYLNGAGADLVRNAGLFLPQGEEDGAAIKPSADTERDARFRRYMVNVFVENGSATGRSGAPILEEPNPTYANLIGRIEHIAQMGTLVTDFLLMRPGAFHKANGGYLLLDARKLLLSPFAWEALKRTIKQREIRIEQPAEASLMMSTQSLDPEPVPLDVKVILIGSREIYYLLAANDPDFQGLFKVQADFDDSIARSSENDRAYARLIASIVKEHKLRPVEAPAVARIIEEGARLADDREKLSIEIGRIADIVREADYWAGEAKRATVTRQDVTRAIEEGVQRADRMRDRAQETIKRRIVLLDVTGAKVGQINGLSVLQLGNFSFGRPTRISARVRLGNGRVTDIEREVDLGGPLHSKGVLILSGFLAGRFGQDMPIAMAASLVFEQSYGGVDGDSASSTELYALLSALADVPIRQGIAVTGSVNQWGEVQAIGGVNEKIEGFFDVCSAREEFRTFHRGLDGEQGVMIPRANVQHLMLREDIVAAVAEKKFSIWAVESIDRGIETLTGVKAGERGSDGRYPAGTINRLVEDRLRTFADKARAFAQKPGGDTDKAATS
ncbi:MAG TPA: AAA family ATPase [Hyphomicrobiaceae bacterium]|nr:AAA family ATPase [Hyphomicrobiaceae bacterium]